MKMPDTITDNLLAPCGLNCMLCHHHCENEKPCEGCRGGKGKSKHCQTCDILACINDKKLEFCAECDEYPCKRVTEFDQMYQTRFGHEFLSNGITMRKDGKEAMIQKLCNDWKCPYCGGVVCIHDNTCSECKKKVL